MMLRGVEYRYFIKADPQINLRNGFFSRGREGERGRKGEKPRKNCKQHLAAC